MPISDKERADMLLTTCENLYIQNVALRVLLDTAKLEGWNDTLDKIVASDLASSIREGLREGYAQAFADVEAKRLKEFLENLPTSGPLQ
jgi:hypothetical protein